MRSLPQLPQKCLAARRPDLHAALEEAATALSIRQVQLAQSVLLCLAGFLGTLQAFRNS